MAPCCSFYPYEPIFNFTEVGVCGCVCVCVCSYSLCAPHLCALPTSNFLRLGPGASKTWPRTPFPQPSLVHAPLPPTLSTLAKNTHYTPGRLNFLISQPYHFLLHTLVALHRWFFRNGILFPSSLPGKLLLILQDPAVTYFL